MLSKDVLLSLPPLIIVIGFLEPYPELLFTFYAKLFWTENDRNFLLDSIIERDS